LGASTIVAIALAGFALYWFAPWNLVVDRRVDEAVPRAALPVDDAPRAPTPAGETPDDVSGVASDGRESQLADPVVLAEGRFRSLEHRTSGSAHILQLVDGSRILRLEDLDTSNGPDLRVVLTDRPVSDDWHVWDDGVLVDLGPLKGNLGSSNYRIPDELDLDRFRTAVVWCRRFSVGFGVAPIDAT
jgi:hypothetical protein